MGTLENPGRMVVINLPQDMKIDANFLIRINEKAVITFMTDSGIFAGVPPIIPTIQVSSLKDVSKYQQISDLYDCDPQLSLVMSTDSSHVEAANHAGFQAILLHETDITADTLCSPYIDSRHAGDRTTLGIALSKMLGLDHVARSKPERPLEYALHVKPDGNKWVI